MRAAIPRGMTLVELLTAMTVFSIAIVAVTAAFVGSAAVAHNAELNVEGDDAARTALEAIGIALRNAGLGAPGGIYVNSGGAPTLINPVFGADGTSGAGGTANAYGFERDDLWVVVPLKGMYGRTCVDPGAYVPVTTGGTGLLTVRCVDSLGGFSTLLASNGTTAALLTAATTTPGPPAQIDYAERAIAGFSNAPSKGGFQVGDQVFPAQALHFYIGTEPMSGHPALYRSVGTLGQDAMGRPFVDGETTLIQGEIEDLQVSYGVDTTNSGNPANYTFQNGLGPAFIPGVRAVRVTVVSRTRKTERDASNGVISSGPISVENHLPAAAPDGYRRAQNSRRFELVNLGASNL